jgi:hypothetical protein
MELLPENMDKRKQNEAAKEKVDQKETSIEDFNDLKGVD